MTSINASLDRPVGKRSTLLILALLGLLTAGLLMLLPGGPAHAQEAGIIRYAENGVDPVRTFTSTDPESATILWDVTGTDADDFTIDPYGELLFTKSPDFESPTDREYDADASGIIDVAEGRHDNMYQITVRATEERKLGVTGRALSTESHITVEVINVDEPGVVELSWLQPEVGTEITAEVTDPDGVTHPTVSLSPDGSGTLPTSLMPDPMDDTDWDVATGLGNDEAIYTPHGERAEGIVDVNDPGVPVDEGKYLRARVTYRDLQGPETTDKTAVMMSAYPVRGEVTSRNDGITTPDNGSPSFKLDLPEYSLPEDRTVGSAVGSAAEATDPNRDTLTYELYNDDSDTSTPARTEGLNDLEFFKIDKATGQITVAKKLDYEAKAPSGEYIVWVRATDPSGESDDQELTITVTDANDAPVIGGLAEHRVMEQDSDPITDPDTATDNYVAYLGLAVETGGVPESRYTAADEDEFDEITWSWEGDDAGQFQLSAQIEGADEPRVLKFKTPPDYENPTDSDSDGVYKVVLVAKDTNGGTDKRPVTIFVENQYELGKLTLAPVQPYVGEEVTVTLADPDEGRAIVTWQWFRSADPEADGFEPLHFDPIEGATSDTYRPEDGDDGRYLRAEVTYTDSTSDEDDPATSQLDERVQKPGPTTAKTPDLGDGSGEDSDHVYRLVVTSEQAVNAEATGTPIVPASVRPMFSVASFTREVAENAMVGHHVGAPIVAQNATMYSLTSGGHDDTNFTIDGNGQIAVANVDADPVDVNEVTRPDLDYETKSTYSISVIAADASGATAEAEVTIRLINLNEGPNFSGDATDPDWTQLTNPHLKNHDENSTAAVANYQGVDPDQANNIVWYVHGTDAGDFTIDGGQLRFREPPDFENPTDRVHGDEEAGDNPNTYNVTVRAAEGTALGGGPLKSIDIDLIVTVVNLDEMGTVDLNLLQPEVGTEITGTPVDPDGVATATVHQWYRAKVGVPQLGSVDPNDPLTLDAEWTTLTAGTGPMYTPVAEDEGKHLLLRVEYTTDPTPSDVVGQQAAIGVSVHIVRADVPDGDNASPDFATNETTRSVPENTAVGQPVGRPVVVDVNEDNDILTYQLVGSVEGNAAVVVGDLPFFSVDKASGQIMLEQSLSAEETDGRTYVDNDANSPVAGIYTVVVRATDPSGETGHNQDDITVKITAIDVREAPRVTEGNAEIEIDEMNSYNDRYVGLGNMEDENTGVVTKNSDPENLYKKEDDDADDGVLGWELRGPDSSLFRFSTADGGIGRRVHFVDEPDYENPEDAGGDNVYNITVVVMDSYRQAGEMAVRIEVMNVDETGKLELMPEQPRIGVPVTVALSDADGILIDPAQDHQTITQWQWYRAGLDGLFELDEEGMVPEALTLIPGATERDYTPFDSNVGQFLYLRVQYRDGHNTEDDPTTEIEVLDERDDGVNNTADPDRFLLARTLNAVQAEPGPDLGGPAQNVAPLFDPEVVKIAVPENTPSTGYVGTTVAAGRHVRYTDLRNQWCGCKKLRPGRRQPSVLRGRDGIGAERSPQSDRG